MDFYTVFSNLIESKGISANRFAIDIGITEGTVRGWKNGTLPSFEALVKTADYFNITLDELAGRVPPQHTEQEIELLNLFRNMDNKQKENLIHYAKFTLS
jgi:transcriptional regulator with XRE-family HTH domain